MVFEMLVTALFLKILKERSKAGGKFLDDFDFEQIVHALATDPNFSC
jgi:hypothetical protein